MYVQKTTAVNTKAEILTEVEELVALVNSAKAPNADSIVASAQPISVVIPFAQGDDETKLLYLIRSIEKSFDEPHKVIILGAKPELNLDVLVIENESKSSNKEINLVHALQAACLNAEVSEKFVVAQLDTYFISPVTLADLSLLKTAKSRILTISDEQAFTNTLRLLSDKGIENARSFACLLPFVIEKSKFAGLFSEFPELDAIPTFIETIYYNYYFGSHSSLELNFEKDNVRLNLISADPNVAKVKELIANKKFLTVWDSAKGDFSENYLNVKFAEKCSLELE